MNDENLISDVSNPHDKLFRETWSNLENAGSFLQHYLPGHVLELMDLSTLEICKDSFVEKELSDYYSDMLYKVMLSGSPGLYMCCLNTKVIMTDMSISSFWNTW